MSASFHIRSGAAHQKSRSACRQSPRRGGTLSSGVIHGSFIIWYSCVARHHRRRRRFCGPQSDPADHPAVSLRHRPVAVLQAAPGVARPTPAPLGKPAGGHADRVGAAGLGSARRRLRGIRGGTRGAPPSRPGQAAARELEEPFAGYGCVTTVGERRWREQQRSVSGRRRHLERTGIVRLGSRYCCFVADHPGVLTGRGQGLPQETRAGGVPFP